jgi:hypothetical protein
MPRRVRWAGHVARMMKISVYIILVADFGVAN